MISSYFNSCQTNYSNLTLAFKVKQLREVVPCGSFNAISDRCIWGQLRFVNGNG
ncbi:hypothetical protein HanRHA438_Chr08g0349471 [Helianthus annuus]|nr:hypothetical protein HanRHA438_Chr08g0349471 [Helianthus annuus]